jgi:hypothetical protein
LGEHQLDKLGVTGSSPVPPIRKGPAQRGFLYSGLIPRTTRSIDIQSGEWTFDENGDADIVLFVSPGWFRNHGKETAE